MRDATGSNGRGRLPERFHGSRLRSRQQGADRPAATAPPEDMDRSRRGLSGAARRRRVRGGRFSSRAPFGGCGSSGSSRCAAGAGRRDLRQGADVPGRAERSRCGQGPRHPDRPGVAPAYRLQTTETRGPAGNPSRFVRRFDQAGVPAEPHRHRGGHARGGSVDGARLDVPVDRRVVLVAGVLQDTLFESIERAGERPQIVLDFAEIFAWDFDFAADSQPGDRFRMLVEKVFTGDQFVKYGRILAAEYQSEGQVHAGVYFKDKDKNGSSYYTPKGESLRRAFLKSPLEFTRISSTLQPGAAAPDPGRRPAPPGGRLRRPAGDADLRRGGRDDRVRRLVRRRRQHHRPPTSGQLQDHVQPPVALRQGHSRGHDGPPAAGDRLRRLYRIVHRAASGLPRPERCSFRESLEANLPARPTHLAVESRRVRAGQQRAAGSSYAGRSPGTERAPDARRECGLPVRRRGAWRPASASRRALAPER